MNTEQFVKVFDVLDSGFRDWRFSAFGLIFVAIGIVIFVFPKIIKIAGIPYLNVRSKSQALFRYSFLGFAVLWTVTSFFATYSMYLRHKALAQEDGCRVVEGPIEHFVPMPYGGHAQESFTVSGVPFKYSDFTITDGFNNTASHGGPITSDSYVRICYDPSGNVILRLEIRDFKGDLKDYAKAQNSFPWPEDVHKFNERTPPVDAPWYGNLFLVPLILDFVAIQVLFLPYLRTFFRLKTTAVRDCGIPETLAAGKKTKLRNSMIYWDRKTEAIWLRPRGFNLVQMPLMVAKLNIDASGKSISGDEIRFSSGFPFVLALFLWMMLRSLSAAIAATNGPSPAVVVGIFASMMFIVGLVNLRIHRTRMEILVQDALSELKEM
jgi:hypothetical protein